MMTIEEKNSRTDLKLARRIGMRIMRRRMELKLSRKALAEITQMDPQYIERYENGRVLPSIIKIQIFARALSVSVDSLLV